MNKYIAREFKYYYKSNNYISGSQYNFRSYTKYREIKIISSHKFYQI